MGKWYSGVVTNPRKRSTRSTKNGWIRVNPESAPAGSWFSPPDSGRFTRPTPRTDDGIPLIGHQKQPAEAKMAKAKAKAKASTKSKTGARKGWYVVKTSSPLRRMNPRAKKAAAATAGKKKRRTTRRYMVRPSALKRIPNRRRNPSMRVAGVDLMATAMASAGLGVGVWTASRVQTWINENVISKFNLEGTMLHIARIVAGMGIVFGGQWASSQAWGKKIPAQEFAYGAASALLLEGINGLMPAATATAGNFYPHNTRVGAGMGQYIPAEQLQRQMQGRMQGRMGSTFHVLPPGESWSNHNVMQGRHRYGPMPLN